jgi:hypothetical protein
MPQRVHALEHVAVQFALQFDFFIIKNIVKIKKKKTMFISGIPKLFGSRNLFLALGFLQNLNVTFNVNNTTIFPPR